MNNKRSLKKTLGVVGNVLFYTAIVFLLLFSIANLQIKSNRDVANVFGKGFLPVLSDSMEGNKPGSFDKGALVFIDTVKNPTRNDFKDGDIITFYDLSIVALNTHRIVDIKDNYVITQGDKAALSAPYDKNGDNVGVQYEIVLYENIKGIHTGSVGGVGSAVSFLQTQLGFALFIILPVVLLLAYQGFVLTKTLLDMNKEKLETKFALDKEQSLKELEAEKERIRQELLEELKKEQK